MDRIIFLVVMLSFLMAQSVHAQEKYITVFKAEVKTESTPENAKPTKKPFVLKQGEYFWINITLICSKESPCKDKSKECFYYVSGKVFRVEADESRKLAYEWPGSLEQPFSAGPINSIIPANWFSGESQILVKGSYLIVMLYSTGKDASGDLLRIELPIVIQ